MRDVEDQFLQWLEWFRLIGFSHLYLYLDDPSHDEEAVQVARGIYAESFVSFALHTPELREEWKSLRTWSRFSSFTEDRMCRQLLNLAHGLRRARGEAVDWVFHLDHDELFLPPPEGLQAHFKHLESGNCRLCLYQNFEAAPQGHSLTPFTDVCHFKVPSGRVSRTPLGAAGLNHWAERTQARTYFLYYDNGKSCVRVKGCADVAPTSVHLLYPSEQLEELIVGRQGWSSFPEQELKEMNLGWMNSCHEELVVAAKVLHYPATHFERLWRKYAHLGDFPAVRFGGQLVVPPSFHLQARDEYLKHSEPKVQQEKLKELLEHAAFLRSEEEVAAQLETGSVVVIDTVIESLRHGSWQPPRQLRPSLYSLVQRRPSKEGMERLQKMRRRPAEVLFPEGLLKDLEAKLDVLVARLAAKGWACCHLGLHGKAQSRALQEARKLRPRMAQGATVIENQVLDPSLPNADRGDRILFMQEQGLSGQQAMKGPAPTLTLLESALTDLGMQLDLRLQRSALRLRITERCDGMLACYDDGGAYSAHVDNADGDGRVDGRILTMVLYLNEWDRARGGELAIFEAEKGDIGDATVEGQWHMVYPEADTLVLFRADRVLHEVRTSLDERYALSMWFCGQHVDYGGS